MMDHLLLFAWIVVGVFISYAGISTLHDKLDDFIGSFPEDDDESPFSAGERRLMEMNEALSTQQDQIMSEIEDLNASVQKMADAVSVAATKLLEEAAQIQASSQKPDAAAMEAAAQRLTGLATSLTNAVNPPEAVVPEVPPANPPGDDTASQPSDALPPATAVGGPATQDATGTGDGVVQSTQASA